MAPKPASPGTAGARPSVMKASAPAPATSAEVAEGGKLAVGDVVAVGKSGQEQGTVRFIGPTEFQAGEWVGVELFNKVGKNDGSVKEKAYFSCEFGYGIFVRAEGVTKVSAPAPATSAEVAEGGKLAVGDVVAVDKSGQEQGTVRFIGPTEFQTGEWVGVELFNKVGKNDGSVKEKAYFSCEFGYGIFVRPEGVTKVQGKQVPTQALSVPKAQEPKAPAPSPRRASQVPAADPKAKAKSPSDKEAGAGKAKAAPEAVSSPAKAKARASTVEHASTMKAGGKESSAAAKAKAKEDPDSKAKSKAVAHASTVAIASSEPSPLPSKKAGEEEHNREKKEPESAEAEAPTSRKAGRTLTFSAETAGAVNNGFEVEKRVSIFGLKGIVRFVGPTKFADGAWVGLELDEPVGKNDGSVQGERYFQCEPNHGMFLQPPKVDLKPVDKEPSAGSAGPAEPAPAGPGDSSKGDAAAPIENAGEQKSAREDEDEECKLEGPDGEEMTLDDLIAAFEESRNELDTAQELLQKAQERERALRSELENAKAAARAQAQRKVAEDGGGSLQVPQLARAGTLLRSSTLSRQGTLTRTGTLTFSEGRGLLGCADVLDNLIMLTDSQRVSHHLMYPVGTNAARASLECGDGCFGEVCFFGLQYMLKKYLVGPVVSMEKIDQAEQYFQLHFAHPESATKEYDPKLFNRAGWEYIVRQYGGELPVVIKALPEGSVVSKNSLLLTLECTDANCFWLVNYLETLLMQVWYPTTVSTQCRELKKLISTNLVETGSAEDVQDDTIFKLHDFGFRGVGSVEAAALGGAAHLVHFRCTENLAALMAARIFYSDRCAGTSRPAADHGTLTAWGREQEAAAMRHFLEKYPKGSVSCASDCYDVYNACEKYWGGQLKTTVEKRQGVVLVRPGSGELPDVTLKVLEKLESKFGSSETPTGHKLLPPCIRVLQAEGVTMVNVGVLLSAMKANGWAAGNVVFGGAGSFLQRVDRDALKCTFKSTTTADQLLPGASASSSLCDGKLLIEIFRDGKLVVDDTMYAIRERAEGKTVEPRFAAKLGTVPRPLQAKAPPVAPKGKAKAKARTKKQELKDKAAEVKERAAQLQASAKKLRSCQTKELGTDAQDSDINAIAQVYEAANGDLEKLAAQCGADWALLRKSPPEDGKDFARKLLEGFYTGEHAELAKQDLRDNLADDLKVQAKKLKRTQTKEGMSGPNASEVEAIAKIYTDHCGDLAKIAALCGASEELLRRSPPADAKDFAENLLKGFYMGEVSDIAKTSLRDRLQEDLQAQASKLKRTRTKEAGFEAAAADVDCLVRLYEQNKGDLDALAAKCGAEVMLLKQKPPTDAQEFARKLLEGCYTGESGEMAKLEFRQNLSNLLQSQAGKLKRTETKDGMSGIMAATEADIECVAKVYAQCDGDLTKLAKVCGANKGLMQKSPPADAKDFAKKLLEGLYTGEKRAEADKAFRDRLLEDLQERASNLQHIEVDGNSREGLKLSDIQCLANVYTDSNGDLEVIAKKCGIRVELLRRHPPLHAKDFATKLFEGSYTEENTELEKANFREQLLDSLKTQAGKLKRAHTKEVQAAPAPSDIDCLANIYTDSKGDLEVIAKKCGIRLELLSRHPPLDAKDFATKLFEGSYTEENTELEKANFREQLLDSLKTQAGKLKRAHTKEVQAAPAASDIDCLANIYTDSNGDLEVIAKKCGIRLELLTRHPPLHAKDFATKLFEGSYTEENTELEKANFREQLLDSLKTQAGKLKRAHTKEVQAAPMASDIECLANIYRDNAGHLEKIAAVCGIPVEMLSKNPPTDANDFGKKLLEGAYTGDSTATARSDLREKLFDDLNLQAQAAQLRHAEIKEGVRGVEASDIACLAKIYTENKGNLARISATCDISLELLKKNPPADAEDFAKKLFEGSYTGQESDLAKSRRKSVRLREQAGVLKKSHTKEMANEAAASDIACVAKIYTDNGADLDRIAALCGVDAELLKQHPPLDANDFAKKLLEGFYTGEAAAASDKARSDFRDQLLNGIQAKAGQLKRAHTKEVQAAPAASDIECIAKIYNDNGGHLEKIAALCGIAVAVLKKHPPASADDFAKKLLEGSYTGETTAMARADLREKLFDDLNLQAQAAQLRHAEIKEGVRTVEASDIACLAKLYTQNKGNLARISATCDISLELLRKHPPADAEDFAKKLFEGCYTGQESDLATSRRKSVSLREQAGMLKKSHTKEMAGEASSSDIACVAKIYTDNGADLDRIAALCGANAELLKKHPPLDANDFAKKLLGGVYSGDGIGSDQARSDFRDQLLSSLQAKAGQLKRSHTKETQAGPSASDTECIAKIYHDNGGHLEKIAEVCGISVEILHKHPPADANDFAKRLLEGAYTGDTTVTARANLREKLFDDLNLQAQSALLKHAEVKEGLREVNSSDIACLAKVYTQNKGNLARISATCDISLELLRKNSPSDAEDFARKLFEGCYTGHESDNAKSRRKSVVLREQVGALKKSHTKETIGEASSSDIACLAKVYNENGGDLDRIAAQCGASVQLLKKHPPLDANDFAKKLLEGFYTGEATDLARSDFRDQLLNNLQAKAGQLKRTNTKEVQAGPAASDIDCIAKLYTDNRGDIEQLAAICGISVEMIRKQPPVDANDFGKKLLAGAYTGDSTAEARSNLREKLFDDLNLQAQAAQLKHAEIKEGLREVEASDIACLAKIYTQNKGNLARISATCDISLDLLRKHPPSNAEDFAKKLFEGCYTGQETDLSKSRRKSVTLRDQAGMLKKSHTKEMAGEASASDIACVAKVYTENAADLDRIAAICGVDPQLLKKHPPLDAEDFAKKLLQGFYSDTTGGDAARSDFRDQLLGSLQAQAGKLKRAHTKEVQSEPAAADIECVAKIYSDNEGNLDKIAAVCGVSVEALKKFPPANANDFGRKLLLGAYTGDTTVTARSHLREKLFDDLNLQAQAAQLRHAEIKEGIRQLDNSDIACLAKIYTQNKGNLARISATCDISLELLRKDPPANADDFAKKLFNGCYTGAESDLAKSRRKSVKLREQAGVLKKSHTKEAVGEASASDIACVAKIYTDNGGDLDRIAALCGANVQILKNLPPADANDFAKKLLEGFYSGEAAGTDVARSDFRDQLLAGLQSQIGQLKRAQTKEVQAGPAASDIECIAKIYYDNEGNKEKIAAVCGIPIAMLNKHPPIDANDFAKKLLEGTYTGDTTAAARSNLREKLFDDLNLQAQAALLKHAEIKEGVRSVEASDLACLAKVYTQNKGNLARISATCDIDLELLRKYAPTDAEDFAKKLFEGQYTGAESDIGKSRRKSVRLREQAGMLKKSNTKEMTSEAKSSDIVAIANIYTDNGADLDKIAALCGANLQLLKQHPPLDANDFAKKLLEGFYTGEAADLARSDFRDQLLSNLQEKAGTLKRAHTKEVQSGPAASDIECVAKIYTDNGGNLEKLAEICGVSLEMLKLHQPADAPDFAKKLLEGTYTGDATATARSNLREKLFDDLNLQAQAALLKHAEIKEGLRGVDSSDVACLAKVYTQNKGNLARISATCDISLDLLKRYPPADAEDFAKKLFEGCYTGQESEASASRRKSVKLREQAGMLKKSHTKEVAGEALSSDVECVAKIYTENEGNLDRIAATCGVSAQLLQKHPPLDANDFAKRLLEGFYSGEATGTDLARSDFREQLLSGLQAKAGKLKRAQTKENQGAPAASDIECVAKIYSEKSGDLDSLAAACGIPVEVLRKNLPTDANDFAKKLLEGTYTGDTTAEARTNLREKLFDDLNLQAQAAQLKHAEIKEGLREVNASDIACLAKVYTQNKGNLARISATCDISLELLRKHQPADANDFAKKLFEGCYTGQESDLAKSRRKSVKLREQAGQLKKSHTKEMAGEASSTDIACVAKIYAENGGDLDRIAAICGASAQSLKQHPPLDANDFAKKLLEGFYSGEATAVDAARSDFREQLLSGLQSQAGQLKRAHTKEVQAGPAASDIECIAKVYTEHEGNLDKIASVCGIPMEMLRKHPPTDANDFAKKLLQGAYTGDGSATARSNLREKLFDDLNLQAQAAQLKHAEIKEGVRQVDASDIACLAKVYTQNKGNLARISATCDISLELLRKDPPADAEDFARKLFEGKYTGAESDMSKSRRKSVRLREQAGMLKKSHTKEIAGEATSSDIAIVAKIYTENGADLDRIAALCGANLQLLKKHPPLDADDFAKKLLEGFYSGEASAIAKEDFRSQLLGGLQAQAGKLKKAQTKEMAGEAASSDIAVVAKIYTENGADLDRIAAACGADVQLLKKHPPLDADDFAKKLLEGSYSGEAGAVAKEDFRNQLLAGLQAKAGKLKKAQTKEMAGEAASSDIAIVAKIYTENGADLDRIAATCGADVQLLKKHPPLDADDFAKKLLEGFYSGEASAIAKEDFRSQLLAGLQAQAGKLKKAQTKEMAGAAASSDIAIVAKIYTENGADLDRIAATCGADVQLLKKHPPLDADDFAKKLLEGAYSGEASAVAQEAFRSQLLGGLQAQAGKLKKAQTKEMAGEATSSDIAIVANIYAENKADLDRIATLCGVNAQLLKKNPPLDADDFAKKLLEGFYSESDASAFAKEEFRSQLLGGLKAQAGKLKKAQTKEAVGEPSQSDIDSIAKIYSTNSGDLDKLAAVCGANVKMLKNNPPKDAEDFARKLLDGQYTGESGGLAKAQLRDRLFDDLQAQASKLKRTNTKEAVTSPVEAEVQQIAKIYTENAGDLEKIASVSGADLILLQKTPPTDASDFARRLLQGLYTGNGAELAKSELRNELSPSNLSQQAGKLKRTQTKEVSTSEVVAAQSDVESVAKIYDEHGGDLAKIAAACGANLEMIRKAPPDDAHDFAKKLLEGLYTGDDAEFAKSELRWGLQDDIKLKKNQLKRTNTKESPVVPVIVEVDVQSVSQIFVKFNGNFEAIAKATGARVELLRRNPPENATDFAKKLLEGYYSSDDTEYGKAMLRDRLADELSSTAGKLKRTNTKASNFTPVDKDIMIITKFYIDVNGDAEKLAEVTGLRPELLKKKPPTSPEDFAKNLLAGHYTGNTTELGKKQLRHRLRADLMAVKKTLKRTKTKESTLASTCASEADIKVMAELYTKAEGDLSKLCAMCGASLELMNKNPPSDANDFAKKLLEGVYASGSGH